MFREDKATAMAVFFLQKAERHELNDVKLMKLLYLAERASLEKKNSTITGDDFVIMMHGQVLSSTLRRMSPHLESKDPARVWRDHIAPCDVRQGNTVKLKLRMDVSETLSRFDVSILESVWTTYGHLTWRELRKICHDMPECVELTGGRMSLKEHEILSGIGCAGNELLARMSDLDYNRRVEELFESSCSDAH